MPNPIPTKVRLGVDVRDRRQCVRCGLASRELHHRQRRREGGHGYDVVVSTCSACHRFIHANPYRAQWEGFIVPTWVTEVWKVPIRAFDGWRLHHQDASVSFLDTSRDVHPDTGAFVAPAGTHEP